MLIAYWIVAGLLAAGYLFFGGTKVLQSKEKLAEGGMGWVENAPAWVVKIVGLLEIAGAIGLILPPLTGFAPVLAPIAAIGLVQVQVGAMILHATRGEWRALPMNAVLLVVAAVVAWLGFAVWA